MLPTKTLYLSFALVAVFSIYATIQGFFFSKIILPNTSTTNLLTKATDSWFEPKTRVIMILVDALRYDFFYYNETMEGHEQVTYQNRYKKVHNIVKNEPENFVMMRAYSDAPTFTVRRTRAIVTGTIPPFISVAQTLGAHEAPEDSILKRMSEVGRKPHTAGDALWTELFPRYVIDAFQSRSFDINRLDSETIVSNKILSVIDENKFNFLIGHTLGVDHIGHYFGSDLDPRIGEQLTASDDLISEIMHKMDNNTILVILGDHGMALDGSHGGVTDEETSTVIAAYYKQGFQKYNTPELSQVMKSIQERPTQVKQVDMAPTLAMLLGVPIPFSNLGQIINDMYPNSDNSNSNSKFAAQMLRDNYLNTLQISQNLDTFNTEAYAFQGTTLTRIKAKFQDIQAAYAKISAMDQETPEFEQEAVKAILQMQEFSENAYTLVRGTNFFDRKLVSLGASIMILTLISHILLGIHAYKCQGYENRHKNSQDMNTKELLKKILSDRVLYGVLFGSLILWAVMKVKTIHVVTSVVLILTLEALVHLGIAVFSAKSKNTFKALESVKVDPAKPQVNLELQHKESSPVDFPLPDEDQEHDQVQVQVPSQRENRDEEHKNLIRQNLHFDDRSKSRDLQIIISISLLIIGIVLTNVEETVRFFEFSNWRFLRHHINEVMAMVLLYAAHTIFKNKTLRTLAYIGVLIVYAIIVIVDAWTTHSLVQSIFFPPVFIWFVRWQSRCLDEPHNKPYLAWLHTLTASILWVYYLPSNRGDEVVTIIIPRVIFGFIFVTAVAGCLLRRSTISQNLKLCLTEFLFLLQGPLHLLPFISLLLTMNITNYLCKRYRVHSFLYAQILALESYFGLYLLDHTDRGFGHVKFSAAFVGLRHFNLYLSVPMVLISLFTSFVLGMMFMSDHLQKIKADWMTEHYENLNTKSSTRDLENDKIAESPQNPQDCCKSPESPMKLESSPHIPQITHVRIGDSHVEENSKNSVEKAEVLQSVKYKANLISCIHAFAFIFFFGIVYIVSIVNNSDFIFSFGTRLSESERYMYDVAIYVFMLVSGVFFIF